MDKHMVFIYIPKNKYPKVREQLAKDSGNSSVKHMDIPVFYADQNSKAVFTSISDASAYAHTKHKLSRFVEAGK